MLDIHFLRANLDQVKQSILNRGGNLSLDEFIATDARRRALITESDSLKARRNAASQEIGALMKAGKAAEAEERKKETRETGDRIKALDAELENVQAKLDELLTAIPNLPHATVPVGRDESANQEVRRWGAPRSFEFPAKDHVEIGEKLGILDLERAAKITGARFALLKDKGALLERALISFMLDTHTREHCYTEVLPPFIVNRQSLFGTGQLPKFEADLFKLTDEREFYLAPTAEVPVTNIHRSEILDGKRLPIKYVAYTPCFRSEAGSYGKDTRGIIRQHQFNKVELVKLTRPEQSYDELESLTRDAEEILRKLEIPYRVVALSTGDLGFSSAKTYDIEVWLPGQNAYREISSCSNFEAFQARRAEIKFRRTPESKAEPVHTLNGSGLAVGRTWVAVVENYQQQDGSVVIPEALRPYCGGLEVITAL